MMWKSTCAKVSVYFPRGKKEQVSMQLYRKWVVTVSYLNHLGTMCQKDKKGDVQNMT